MMLYGEMIVIENLKYNFWDIFEIKVVDKSSHPAKCPEQRHSRNHMIDDKNRNQNMMTDKTHTKCRIRYHYLYRLV